MKKLLCSLLAAGLLALLAAISIGVGPAAAENSCDNCVHIIGGHGAPTKSGGNDNCVALCGLSVAPPKLADKTDCPPGDSGSPIPVGNVVHFGPAPIPAGAGCPPAGKGKTRGTDPTLSEIPVIVGPNGGGDPGTGPGTDCVVPDGKIRDSSTIYCPKGKGKPPVGGGAGRVRASAALHDCETQLSGLRDVSERDVRSVDNSDRVRLVPICDTLVASLTQAHVDLLDHGNAASLIPAIARNNTLYANLHRARYTPDNVVGIVMARDLVVLYVHKR